MKITELKIDPEFAGKIPPLTDENAGRRKCQEKRIEGIKF